MKTLYKTIINILAFVFLNYFLGTVVYGIIEHTFLLNLFTPLDEPEFTPQAYIFLLSIIYLLYLTSLKKNIFAFITYVVIPVVGIVISFNTYPLVDKYILLPNLYCFYVYTITGVVCIILGNVIFKNRK